tara:strand:+ start:92 stop:355 length:264 start_codon:yes stop_codon:yes gene_type:complete
MSSEQLSQNYLKASTMRGSYITAIINGNVDEALDHNLRLQTVYQQRKFIGSNMSRQSVIEDASRNLRDLESSFRELKITKRQMEVAA